MRTNPLKSLAYKLSRFPFGPFNHKRISVRAADPSAQPPWPKEFYMVFDLVEVPAGLGTDRREFSVSFFWNDVRLGHFGPFSTLQQLEVGIYEGLKLLDVEILREKDG